MSPERTARRGEIPRYQLEKRYIRKDGSVVDIMLSGSILRGPDNAPLYYIAQVEDISERKRPTRFDVPKPSSRGSSPLPPTPSFRSIRISESPCSMKAPSRSSAIRSRR